MNRRFDDVVDATLSIRQDEGPSKVTTIREAVKKYVTPGMMLHFTATHSSAMTAVNEITRQFWGTSPGFTLIGGVTSLRLNLVHGGLVRKIIGSFCGDSYPTPGPNPVIQKAYREKVIEIEHWTMCTIPQRLMAAALGVGFMPTRSLIGSTMAEENKESFRVIDDPLGSGQKLGVMKALSPDISFVHAWAADSYGNALLVPPYGENLWGALAARNGAILTVERLVPTEFLRQHSALVKLPGYVVNCVCVEPFGAHPNGLTNHGLEEMEGYGDDYDFIIEHRQATRDPQVLDAWIKDWVLDCKTHRDYLRKLGPQRLLFLKGKVKKDSWRQELDAIVEDISPGEECNPVEMMAIVGARKIKERILQGGHKTLLAGVGVSNLAAWLAYYQLKNEGYDIDLAAEIGFYGYAPRPGDPWIFSFYNIPTCKMLTDIVEVLGVIVGGENNRAIGALAGGQIDKFGNINSTKISDEFYIAGSGGANDVASAAREVVVTIAQSRGRFVEKVPYITSPGERVKTVVSTLGVLEKLGADNELTLTECFYNPKLPTLEEKVEAAKENCGWELKVAPKVKEVPPPQADELTLLRLFDPYGRYLTI